MTFDKRAYLREYYQRPEIKAKHREKRETRKLVREYQTLMLLKNPSRLAVLRLSAIADILGRDLEEWRTKEQKEVWI